MSARFGKPYGTSKEEREERLEKVGVPKHGIRPVQLDHSPHHNYTSGVFKVNNFPIRASDYVGWYTAALFLPADLDVLEFDILKSGLVLAIC